MSRTIGSSVLTGLLASAVSVFVAWLLSVASDRFYLPVVVTLGNEPASLLYLFAPISVTIALGRRWRFSPAATGWTAVLIGVVTIALSWMAWIGWIIVVCSNGGCFE